MHAPTIATVVMVVASKPSQKLMKHLHRLIPRLTMASSLLLTAFFIRADSYDEHRGRVGP
jgi:preprotein translocase subunit SecY